MWLRRSRRRLVASATTAAAQLDAQRDTDGGQDDHDDDDQYDCPFQILPPHFAIDFDGSSLELIGRLLQYGRLVDEILQIVAALQNLVDILGHDTFHIVDLCLKLREIGRIWALVVRCLFFFNKKIKN